MNTRFDTAYTYHFINSGETQFLCIIDGNQGMSLTNNIENVVKQISEQESIDPALYVIIYQDSEGMWDQWSYQRREFYVMSATSEARAIQTYLKKHNKT